MDLHFDTSHLGFDRSELLARLRVERDATQGWAPFNFHPLYDVCDILSVHPVSSWDVPVPAGAAPQPNVYACCLLWTADEKYFIPWSTGTVLQVGTCRSTPYFKSKAGEGWGAAIPEAQQTEGGVVRVNYYDPRFAEKSAAMRKPKPFQFIVVVRLSPELAQSETVRRLMLSGSGKYSLPQCDFEPPESLTAEADEDLAVTSDTISLQCPFSLVRIETPVRHRSETVHEQCFELNSLVSCWDQKRPGGLRCFVCNAVFYMKDLVIDTTFLSFLQAHRSSPQTKFQISREQYVRQYSTAHAATNPILRGLSGFSPRYRVVRSRSTRGLYSIVQDGNGGSNPATHTALKMLPFVGVKDHFVLTGQRETVEVVDCDPAQGQWKQYPNISQPYFVAEPCNSG
eukprot:gene18480-28521_t